MTPVLNRPYKGTIRAAIFDWAGTVCDYGCMAPAVVFVEVFKQYGFDISLDEARVPMGANKRDHIQQIIQIPGVADRWKQAKGQDFNVTDLDTLYKNFIPLQVECIADYSDLIPGTIEMVEELRSRGIKIGSCTGYSKEMMDVLVAEAKKKGFEPDCVVSSTDVPNGRPHPWMCFKNAMDLEVYPLEACVKIGDTLPDIYEGLNAGMWTIGVTVSGNEVGLSEQDVKALDAAALNEKRLIAEKKLKDGGAHYVVDSVADILPIIEDINKRLANGEKP